jgi:hypothetical protein
VYGENIKKFWIAVFYIITHIVHYMIIFEWNMVLPASGQCGRWKHQGPAKSILSTYHTAQ